MEAPKATGLNQIFDTHVAFLHRKARQYTTMQIHDPFSIDRRASIRPIQWCVTRSFDGQLSAELQNLQRTHHILLL